MSTPKNKTVQVQLKLSKGSWGLIALYTLILSIVVPLCLFPLLAELHYRKAYLYSNEGTIYNFRFIHRFEYAFQEYEKAITYFPWENQYIMEYVKDLDSYAKRITNQEEQLAIYTKITTLLDRLIFIDPYNPWYRSKYTTISFDLYRLTKDTNYIKNSIEQNRIAAFLDYENPIFLLNYASILHQNRYYSEAFYYYKKTIDIDQKRYPQAFINIAELYRRFGHNDLAYEHYIKARDIQLNNNVPINEKLDSTIILFLIEEKDFKQAATFINDYRLIESDNPYTLAGTAIFYYTQNYYTTAIALFEKYLELSQQRQLMPEKQLTALYLISLKKNNEHQKASDQAKFFYSLDKDPRYEAFF
jgi:tetratricopeptide (TPR) repeat protein